MKFIKLLVLVLFFFQQSYGQLSIKYTPVIPSSFPCKESYATIDYWQIPQYEVIWNSGLLYRWNRNSNYLWVESTSDVPTPTYASQHEFVEVIGLLSYRTLEGVDTLIQSNTLFIPVIDCLTPTSEPIVTKTIKAVWDFYGRELSIKAKGLVIVQYTDGTYLKEYRY